MLQEFWAYLVIGFRHIADLNAHDHIVFVITLCAFYPLKEWRALLIMVTAFTIGHSLTLALVALDVIHPDAAWVEFLIPVTIFFTAIVNVLVREKVPRKRKKGYIRWNYLAAGVFGLIHGMGFSTYLRSFFTTPKDIVWPLFSFNVGLEIGQLLIVAIFLGFLFLGQRVLGIKHRDWRLFLSGLAGGMAIKMMIETFPN